MAGYREERRQQESGMALAAAFDTNGFRPSKQAERDTELAFGLQWRADSARGLTACGPTLSPSDGARAAGVRCSADSANAPVAPSRERNSD